MYEHNDPDALRQEKERADGKPWLRPGLADEVESATPRRRRSCAQEYEDREDRPALADEHPRLGPFPRGKAEPPGRRQPARLIKLRR